VPDERRRHVRKQVDLAGYLEREGERSACHVSDMSAGGACLDVLDPPEFGAKVRLVVPLPSGHELVVDGVIRWRRPTGTGLQFSPMGARQTYHLTEFLAGLDPLPDSRMVGR
jgi:hypothetical protein